MLPCSINISKLPSTTDLYTSQLFYELLPFVVHLFLFEIQRLFFGLLGVLRRVGVHHGSEPPSAASSPPPRVLSVDRQ